MAQSSSKSQNPGAKAPLRPSFVIATDKREGFPADISGREVFTELCIYLQSFPWLPNIFTSGNFIKML